MRITFDLPDWAIGKTINIFAGKELLAKKKVKVVYDGENHIQTEDQSLMVKTLPEYRCNGCGDCCSQGGSPFPQKMLAEITYRLDNYTFSKNGKCPLLGEDGCIMKGSIPFSCAKSNCEGWSENCSEKLIAIEDIEDIEVI
jgi:hypothetical protein